MSKDVRNLIGGIQRFSTEDGPGIRTTLFLKGCPLNCKWCHNPELISKDLEILYYENKCIKCGNCIKACPKAAIVIQEGKLEILRDRCIKCGNCAGNCYTGALKAAGEEMEFSKLIKTLIRDKSFYEETGGGVTLSGGEVTSQGEYALEITSALRSKKISVAIDTCGYTNYENLKKLCLACDYILYDIKCMNSARHKELTGVNNEIILKNLRKLASDLEIKGKIIIRMPLIHPVNDAVEDMKVAAEFISELGLEKVNLIPYHELGIGKSRSLGIKPEIFETPTDAHLDEILEIFKCKGIDADIMGRDK